MTFNSRMHVRNIYKIRPDFAKLALDYPEFRKYVYPNEKGKYHIDFKNTEALRMLTKILLKKDFNLSVTIPDGFLIPTVPQRLNYILWVEDLLNIASQNTDSVLGIDIGTGPCAIFSLLGAKKNNWKFVATESSEEAINWARKNIEANNLHSNIEVLKVDKGSTLKEVLASNKETYNFCLCNPPFFENIEEIRKKNVHSKKTIADVAKKEEIFAEGGEIAFVKSMIEDSLFFRDRVCLYTSMFGKKKSFVHVLNELKSVSDLKTTTSEFCQGNTVRWGIAWTFAKSFEFPEVQKVKQKAKLKPKPPLTYNVPETIPNPEVIVTPILERVVTILNELKIDLTLNRTSKNFAELFVKAVENTWSHQRRKRRELLRKTTQSSDSPNKLSVFSASESNHDKNTDSTSLPEKNEEDMQKSEKNQSLEERKHDYSKKNEVEDIREAEKNHSSKKRKHDCYGENLEESPETVQNQSLKKRKHDSSGEKELEDTREAEQTQSLKKRKRDSSGENESEDTQEAEQTQSLKKRKHDSSGKNDLESSKSSNQKKCVLTTSVEKEIGSVPPENYSMLLDCCLRIRKAKNHILLEMTCTSNACRDSMHQVFQLVKNKLK